MFIIDSYTGFSKLSVKCICPGATCEELGCLTFNDL